MRHMAYFMLVSLLPVFWYTVTEDRRPKRTPSLRLHNFAAWQVWYWLGSEACAGQCHANLANVARLQSFPCQEEGWVYTEGLNGQDLGPGFVFCDPTQHAQSSYPKNMRLGLSEQRMHENAFGPHLNSMCLQAGQESSKQGS